MTSRPHSRPYLFNIPPSQRGTLQLFFQVSVWETLTTQAQEGGSQMFEHLAGTVYSLALASLMTATSLMTVSSYQPLTD